MTLNEKQCIFTFNIAHLLVWCGFHGYRMIGAEWHRPQFVADIYAEQGKGIRNSLHVRKLALDMFRYKNGTITWDPEDYRPIGEHWKTMHELNRWGGDFPNRDAVHFSMEHGGIK